MNRIYYAKPSITELEIKYAADAASKGWGDNCYNYISRFENQFKEYLGVKYAIATSSCTGALHMGLSAIGIKPGDEVILADINWIASAAPITYLGAKPVFVDILPDTWCIDPSKIKPAINSKTKAIIAVHLYGNLCDMDEINQIAQKHNLYVIEDAAEAIGSVYKGKKAGSIGDYGSFSFHGTKTITTGEGGMFVTDRQDLYDKVLTMSNHGRSSHNPKQFWPEIIGYKYKMSNIQAAIGCGQLERVNELVARKRYIFNKYKKLLSNTPKLTMNTEKESTINGYWMPIVVFEKSKNFDRDAFFDICKKNNIDGRQFFYPLSSLPMFDKIQENTVGYDMFKRAINLPSYHEMLDTDIIRVAELIKQI